jgi:hypothetical protein
MNNINLIINPALSSKRFAAFDCLLNIHSMVPLPSIILVLPFPGEHHLTAYSCTSRCTVLADLFGTFIGYE